MFGCYLFGVYLIKLVVLSFGLGFDDNNANDIIVSEAEAGECQMQQAYVRERGSVYQSFASSHSTWINARNAEKLHVADYDLLRLR